MRLMVLGIHIFCLSVALALTLDSGSNNMVKMLDNGDKSAIIRRIQRSYSKTRASCYTGATCASGVCAKGKCQAPTCRDNVKNQDETDVDCGGTHCRPCADRKKCCFASECVSKVCTHGICQVPTCQDGVKNQDETDVNCGGTHCALCHNGKKCLCMSDCISGQCRSGVCQATTTTTTTAATTCTSCIVTADGVNTTCAAACGGTAGYINGDGIFPYLYFSGNGYTCVDAVTTTTTKNCYLAAHGNGLDIYYYYTTGTGIGGYYINGTILTDHPLDFPFHYALAGCNGATGYYCCCQPTPAP